MIDGPPHAKHDGVVKMLKWLGNLERAKGFEPSTPTLARLCSTPELHPLARRLAASRAYMAEVLGDCNREIPLQLLALPGRIFAR